MQSAYDVEAVKALVGPAIKGLKRGGQTALARATGVEPQTVNKWSIQQTHPTPDKWDAIEAYLGWDTGMIASSAGLARSTAEMSWRDQIEARLARLEELAGPRLTIVPEAASTPTRNRQAKAAKSVRHNPKGARSSDEG